MGVLKNDVGRPSKKTIKTRRLLTLLIVVVAFAAGFFISYVLATKIENPKSNDAKIDKGKKRTIVANREVSPEEAQKIMEERFIYNGFIDDTELVNSNNYKTLVAIIHTKKSNKTYKCKDLFDSLYKVDYANDDQWFMKIKDDDYEYMCTDNTEYTYDYKSVNNKYHDLFYNSKNDNVVKGYIGSFPSYYVYSKTKDVYALVDSGGHLGIKSIFGIKKAEIKNNELIIDYATLYGQYEDGEFVAYEEYGNDIHFPADTDLSEAFEKYKDQINPTIRLYFKIVNGKYMFDRAEDIK